MEANRKPGILFPMKMEVKYEDIPIHLNPFSATRLVILIIWMNLFLDFRASCGRIHFYCVLHENTCKETIINLIMLSPRRRCATPITKPYRPKVKVIIEGKVFEPSILCPLHTSWTAETIFIKKFGKILPL